MIIEVMVRWTEMRIKQGDQEQAYLDRLIEGKEDQHNYVPEFFYQFSPMTFELNDVARFNRSQDRKSTTLRFKDGDVVVADIPYEEFRSLYIQSTGMAVHSTITKAQEKAAAEGPKPTPEQDGSISGSDDYNI